MTSHASHAIAWPRTDSIGALVARVWLAIVPSVSAQATAQTSRVAVPVSLTGISAVVGIPVMNAARMAVEEANALGNGPPIELDAYDDRGDAAEAREIARRIVASQAQVVMGPGITVSAGTAGPVYNAAGLANIVPHAHGAPEAPTTFRIVFGPADMGEAMANHLFHVLGHRRVAIVFRDNPFGRPIAEGLRRAADRLGLDASLHGFTDPAAAADIATRIGTAQQSGPFAIALCMVEPDAKTVLVALRRTGTKATVIGASPLATDQFARYFQDEPEERRTPGFFVDGVYAVSPIMLDSGNAETLAFAERYRARHGDDPLWNAVQGYDATRLAIAALRATEGIANRDARRTAVVAYLRGIDSPARAVPSLTGPLWFEGVGSRPQAARIGRFRGGTIESAPVQLVPITVPTAAEIASGTLVETGPGRWSRRQQVVHAGALVNEIPRIDVVQSTFSADFYVWLRFVVAPNMATDPAEIDFPDMVRATFDPARPAARRQLDDGTTYQLWRVRGDFKNDFNLRRYPFDQQSLRIRMFNARAASDTVVYVRDRRGPVLGSDIDTEATLGGTVEAAAFRNLTQWQPLRAGEFRDNLVTQSALGDPGLVDAEKQRELSGFRVEIDLRRYSLATLAKTLLPMGIVTLIMLASLWFPHGLVKEKIAVSITAALSGAVMLNAVNAQLGPLGYTVAVEYAFYLFFALSLLCTVSVLPAEQLRVGGRTRGAGRVEVATRSAFLAVVAATGLAMTYAAMRW